MKLALLLLLLLSTPAFTEERKIDFTTVPTDAYGQEFEPVCTKVDEGGKCLVKTPVTLGFVCVTALGNALDADKGEDYRKKLERDDLARRIATAEKTKQPIALKSEDIVALKERVGKFWTNATLVGAVIHVLEPVDAK